MVLDCALLQLAELLLVMLIGPELIGLKFARSLGSGWLVVVDNHRVCKAKVTSCREYELLASRESSIIVSITLIGSSSKSCHPILFLLRGAAHLFNRVRLVHHCFLLVVALSKVHIEEIVLFGDSLPGCEDCKQTGVPMLCHSLRMLQFQAQNASFEQIVPSEVTHSVLCGSSLPLTPCIVVEDVEDGPGERAKASRIKRLHN